MTLPSIHIHPVLDIEAAVLGTRLGTSGRSAKKGTRRLGPSVEAGEWVLRAAVEGRLCDHKS